MRRTSSFGITFPKGTAAGLSIQVFADVDMQPRHLTGGQFREGLVMCRGACVSWCSRTQKYITLSTTESEYVARADVMKEVLFLKQVRRFMLPAISMSCIPVFEYNEGAEQITQSPITNSNSKHIDERHHFLWELVGRKEIPIRHAPPAFQHVDFLTKPIAQEPFEFHRDFVINL